MVGRLFRKYVVMRNCWGNITYATVIKIFPYLSVRSRQLSDFEEFFRNIFRTISLKSYVEVGRHRGMILNENIYLFCLCLLVGLGGHPAEVDGFFLLPWLMEPGGSMSHSHGLSNNSYPETNQPNSPH